MNNNTLKIIFGSSTRKYMSAILGKPLKAEVHYSDGSVHLLTLPDHIMTELGNRARKAVAASPRAAKGATKTTAKGKAKAATKAAPKAKGKGKGKGATQRVESEDETDTSSSSDSDLTNDVFSGPEDTPDRIVYYDDLSDNESYY